ncbi:MAG: heavy-metal-associated domain-containing protein [Lachnospiraceae bacterium]|nr:heavy-metal-associated domain-containing protein [Lachnospiraceae bacterium]
MTTLKVQDMHCNKCVERISKALDDAKLTYTVSLDDKTVTIDGCEHCVKTAIAELDDLGFEAVIQA